MEDEIQNRSREKKGFATESGIFPLFYFLKTFKQKTKEVTTT